MIKLPEGGFADLWGGTKSPEIIAISYALQMQVVRIVAAAEKTRCFSGIDNLDEDKLDYLSVELRAMYYDQSLDIDVKRSIIKNTLTWSSRAGTPSAVNGMMESLFGAGHVVEWFDFPEEEREPWIFDLVTEEPMREDIMDYLLQVIGRVKNERSHLRRVLIERKIKAAEKANVGMVIYPSIQILNNAPDRDPVSLTAVAANGSTHITYPNLVILNTVPGSEQYIQARGHEGVGLVTSAHVTITNQAQA